MRPWIVTGAGAVVYALVTFWATGRLPEDGVPTHLAADGTADRFGTAGEVIGVWAALGIGMVALAIVAILLAQRGPLRIMNIPNRGYWTAPQRVEILRRMLADDVSVVMGGTLAFLALVPVWMTLAANSTDRSLSPVVLWLPLVLYLVGLVAWTAWLVRVRYRPQGQ